MFSFGKKEFAATVNSSTELIVKKGQNLLAAGLKSGLDWPHDCRVGSCGTCRCRLLSGKIKPLSDFTYVLAMKDIKQGYILACQTRLKSDIAVEVLFGVEKRVAVETREARVSSVRTLTHDILELVITAETPFPPGMTAGQYAEIIYPGLSSPRSYSFATDLEDQAQSTLTFYIRNVPGGEFTGWLFAKDRHHAELTVSAPYGDFCLHDNHKTMICIAGGSGMSGIKAILEKACRIGAKRDVVFLFGARTQRDSYCAEEIGKIGREWNSDHQFIYETVLSDELPGNDWTGPRGFVTDYFQQKYLQESGLDILKCEAYLCGPPAMVDAGIKMLTEAGLQSDAMFYDKFLDASTIEGGR